MFKNNKGWVLAGFPLVAACLIGAMATAGTIDNAQSGQLKKNGQSIWAHMQGKCTGDAPDARCIMPK